MIDFIMKVSNEKAHKFYDMTVEKYGHKKVGGYVNG